MSLRRLLSVMMVALGVVAVVMALSLVGLTTLQGHAAQRMRAAVESVRLAEDAQVQLLLYARAPDAFTRQEAAGRVRQRVATLDPWVKSPHGQQVLDQAQAAVEAYLAQPAEAGQPERLGAAFAALQALTSMKMEQARTAEQEALQADTQANILGVLLAVLLLAGVAGMLVWLWGTAFRSVRELQQAMQRFGEGDPGVRAPENGPAELQAVAHGFNSLAETLARQQERQRAFLAGVVHDLRNPLGALRLAAASMGAELPVPDVPRLRRTASLIERQVTLMDRMLGDLLDRARIEAGQLEVRPESTDVRLAARHVVELYQATVSRHHLVLQLPEDSLLAWVDGPRVEQVLSNLVSNAIKYSPDGGTVTVRVTQDAGQACLSVADQGVGIRAEDQARVFEPFQRAAATRDMVPGTGLGLHVSRRIVQALRGRLEVESAPGQGSVFRVWLPLHGPVAPAGPA